MTVSFGEKEQNYITMGCFGRVHGIKGDIFVRSFSEPFDNLLQYAPWYMHFKQVWQPIVYEEISAHQDKILVRVKGFETREAVAQLTGTTIYVERSVLPPSTDGDYYWHELIGLSVINQDNTTLGKITDIIATGSNDVLVVEGEKRHLIPYLYERVIVSVDLNAGCLRVDWDES